MSSSGDRVFVDVSNGDNNNDDYAPTHHPPWPYTSDPFLQGRFERKFIADGGTINFDTLPRLQPWFAGGDKFRVVSVLARVGSCSSEAKRPLTSTEAHAVGEHAAYSLRRFAWSEPVSIGIALAVSLAGRRTFKFPIYQPKMIKFYPYSFPTRKWSLLKGRRAVSTWHIIRFVSYLTLTTFPTVVVFGSIADSSFRAHIVRDSRLAGMADDIRQNVQRKRIEHQMQHRAGARVPPQTGPSSYQDSPTPQNYGSSDRATQSSYSFERPTTATEAHQSTQPNWPQNTSTQPASRRMQENVRPSESRHEDDAFDPFDDDDASPVAPSARRPGMGQGSTSPTSSSWDRIREQAKSGASNWERGDSSGQEKGWAQLRQDKTRNPKDSTPKTDSYSYSGDDEDRERRNYERQQAQNEFDALVEAERRGDGNSSNSRGWRKG
ncbi:hypothetical protein GGR51DRAFT_195563 [Nemania sp. FL0031]|nr:hypothetical protein GGR51DRAFT_195563 [Nemania sp. FL0031]